MIPRILLGLVLVAPVTVQASLPYWCPERGTDRCRDFKTEEEKTAFLSDRIKQIDHSLKKDGVALFNIIYAALKVWGNKQCLEYLSMEPSQELIEKLKEKGMDVAACDGRHVQITFIADIEFAGDGVYVVYSGFKAPQGFGVKLYVSRKRGYWRVEKDQRLWTN